MKTVLKNIFYITLPTLAFTFLLLEAIFRWIIPSSNQPDYFFDRQYGILKFNNYHNQNGLYTIGKFAEQRGHWSINNAGWNSPYDYKSSKSKKRIAIIGDSYIEALMIDNTNTYPSILNKRLVKDYEVYSFGISGAPLSQYLNMSRYVVKEFNPDILIFNIIHNDFDESLRKYSESPFFSTIDLITDTTAIEVPPKAYTTSTLRSTLKKSAFIRYLLFNVHALATLNAFSLEAKEKSNTLPVTVNANINVSQSQKRVKEITYAVTYACKTIKKENSNKRIIFVMDASRNDIYTNTLEKCNVCFLNAIMKKAVLENEMEFIDLTGHFYSTWIKEHKPFNSAIDFHWNEYGHKIVADTLYEYLIRN